MRLGFDLVPFLIDLRDEWELEVPFRDYGRLGEPRGDGSLYIYVTVILIVLLIVYMPIEVLILI